MSEAASSLIARLIDEALESDESDPGVLASRIGDKIPANALRSVVVHLLRAAVRDRIRIRRNKAPRPSSSEYVTAMQDRSAFLNQRLEVPGKGWKPLGDFNYEELLATAAELRRRAELDIAQADPEPEPPTEDEIRGDK